MDGDRELNNVAATVKLGKTDKGKGSEGNKKE